MTALNDDDLIESLVVHSYDTDLLETHSKHSFKSTKLIDFSLLDLKNTNDYLKFFLGELLNIIDIYLIFF